MHRQTRLTYFLLSLLLIFWPPRLLAQQQAGTKPREQLQQYVAQLKNDQDNQGLRQKIIKLAQQIKPAPGVPEEARKHFVVGTTLAKDAKNPSDCQGAADELNKALLMAPWWGEAYWNLSGALLCGEKYEEAKLALRFFLDTNPKPDDARAAQDRTYTLEAKGKEKQARAQQQAPPPAEKRRQEQADFIKSLDGACYSAVNGTAYLFIRRHQLWYAGWNGQWILPQSQCRLSDHGCVSDETVVNSNGRYRTAKHYEIRDDGGSINLDTEFYQNTAPVLRSNYVYRRIDACPSVFGDLP